MAERAQVMMNQDFLYSLNKVNSEDERFYLALFTAVRKLLKKKQK
ncbi:MAG: hypothetical protein ACFFD2_12395 [Promethearchaeota archaeon]